MSAKATGRSVDVIAGVALDAERRTAAFAIVVAGLVLASAPHALHNGSLELQRKRISRADEHNSMLRTIPRFHSRKWQFGGAGRSNSTPGCGKLLSEQGNRVARGATGELIAFRGERYAASVASQIPINAAR